MSTDKPKMLLTFEELYHDLLNELGCLGHQGAVVEIRRLRTKAGLSDKPKDEDSYKDYVQVEEKTTLPTINAIFETETKELIGTTDARIKRIDSNEDGSITVVIDHWPVTVTPKQPSPSEISILEEIERLKINLQKLLGLPVWVTKGEHEKILKAVEDTVEKFRQESRVSWCEGCNPNNCSGCHTPLNKVASEPTKDN